MGRKTLASSADSAKNVVKRGSKTVEKQAVALSSSTRKTISAAKPRGSRVAKGIMAKARKSAASDEKNKALVDNSPSDCIYLGHIPSGFGEKEMRKFFIQFGDVKKVKLFRNKKSLASRGYAYINFDNATTASTVADAINGYFLGERQLVSHVVSKNKLHSGMFKVPIMKKTTDEIQSKKRKSIADGDGSEAEGEPEGGEDQLESIKSIAKASANLKKKQKKLAALGIEYDFLDTLTEKLIPTSTEKIASPEKEVSKSRGSAKKKLSKKSK